MRQENSVSDDVVHVWPSTATTTDRFIWAVNKHTIRTSDNYNHLQPVSGQPSNNSHYHHYPTSTPDYSSSFITTDEESCCQSSLQSTSLSRHAARCSQLVFGQLCSMAVRPGRQTPPIYNGFAEMTVPCSGGSAMQSWKMRFPRLCFTRNWM